MEAGPGATGPPPPNQPSLSLPGPRTGIFRAHPQDPGGAQAMLPLGNRNKCPVNTTLSVPRGLNMQREFCWEPPSNQLLCPWGWWG